MIAWLIALVIAAGGGIITYIFRQTIGAKLFPKPLTAAQQAAETLSASLSREVACSIGHNERLFRWFTSPLF